MQKSYESMVIVRGDINDEDKNELFAKVMKKITDLGGSVAANRIWAPSRSLTFSLVARTSDKKRHTSGCFWLVNFMANTQSIDELKALLGLDERILRSLILKREDKPAQA